jgi:hypothetical protein
MSKGLWMPSELRFWFKVDLDSGPCWEWTGARDSSGYGQFYIDGHEVRAHRYAWELLRSPSPLA